MPTSGTMEGITQDQARSLFAAGSFLVLQNLPPGSEFSVDGGPVYQVGSSFEVRCSASSSSYAHVGDLVRPAVVRRASSSSRQASTSSLTLPVRRKKGQVRSSARSGTGCSTLSGPKRSSSGSTIDKKRLSSERPGGPGPADPPIPTAPIVDVDRPRPSRSRYPPTISEPSTPAWPPILSTGSPNGANL